MFEVDQLQTATDGQLDEGTRKTGSKQQQNIQALVVDISLTLRSQEIVALFNIERINFEF